MRSRLILLLIPIFVVRCGELKSPTEPAEGGDPIDQTATFTRVQNEIFTPNCTFIGCHDPLGKSGEMVLTPGNAYANTVNANSSEMPQLKRIAPNDFPNSYLYRKITGAGITGERMPLQRPPLTDAQIALVRNWIRRGAPND